MASIIGTNNSESLVGTSGADVINAAGGSDHVSGKGGRDKIKGGAGGDRLFGDAGNDILHGQAGNDIINGGKGGDTSLGGLGNDLIRGQQGNDRLFGNAGNDRLLGDAGNDKINGGAGNDKQNGGAGLDTLWAGAGNDTHSGGQGTDSLVFAGNMSEYDFSAGPGAIIVSHVRGSAIDGRDLVFADVEQLVFKDRTISTAAAPPVAAGDTTTTSEDAPVAGASVLSNDFDAQVLLGIETMTVSAVNGNAGAVGNTITLGSGARVTMQANGTYAYDSNAAFDHLGFGETATDSFTYTVSDGAGGTSSATVTVTVTGVDDAPTLDVSGASVLNVAVAGSVLISPTVSITDVDDDHIEGAVVKIAAGFKPGDSLIFTGQNGISGAFDSQTGVLTLTGSASLSAYETALESVIFKPQAANGIIDLGPRQISYMVTDGDLSSEAGVATVSVVAGGVTNGIIDLSFLTSLLNIDLSDILNVFDQGGLAGLLDHILDTVDDLTATLLGDNGLLSNLLSGLDLDTVPLNDLLGELGLGDGLGDLGITGLLDGVLGGDLDGVPGLLDHVLDLVGDIALGLLGSEPTTIVQGFLDQLPVGSGGLSLGELLDLTSILPGGAPDPVSFISSFLQNPTALVDGLLTSLGLGDLPEASSLLGLTSDPIALIEETLSNPAGLADTLVDTAVLIADLQDPNGLVTEVVQVLEDLSGTGGLLGGLLGGALDGIL